MPMKQIFFAFPERDDFLVVPGRPGFLQPVDFPLNVGPFPVVAQTLQGPDTVGGVGRSPRLPGDFLDESGFSCT